MELQVGVKVLLKNPEGKYLVILRTAEKYKEVTHKWDIPGGRISTDTDLLKNLMREVKEETGLEMSSIPKLIAAQDIFNNEGGKHVVRLTYTGLADGEPKLSEEHSEYRWVSTNELKELEGLDKYLKQLFDEGSIS